MNIFKNIFIKLSFISTVYIVTLIFAAPVIDHIFTSLEEDKRIKETNLQILSEIILHVIALTIVWYFLHNSLKYMIEQSLNIKIKAPTQSAIDIISAVALIGLQTNLIEKLKYVTIEHPFRLTELYE